MDFAGKHVWIIGASTGIGRALAFELAEKGANLAISARDGHALRVLNTQLESRCTVLPLDVTDAASVASAARALPRIDSVILMAGHYVPGLIRDLDAQTQSEILNVNLGGAFNLVRAVLPVLHSQNGGQIVLCGSVAGYRGLPMGQPYSATKAAILNLAESLRAEESRNNIDVRVISPGFVRTRMTARNSFRMPMMIEPADAARAIVSGLEGRAFEIHFPRRFTLLMKLLRVLPDALYFALARRL